MIHVVLCHLLPLIFISSVFCYFTSTNVIYSHKVYLLSRRSIQCENCALYIIIISSIS